MAVRSRGVPSDHRRQWSRIYEEHPYHELPWFSSAPYPWVAEAVRGRWWRPSTRILDLGCGAGTNTLFLARSGFRVSGVDVAPGAIDAARRRTGRAGVDVDLRVADVLRLPYVDRAFGGAIDIGCFHTLPIHLRRAYSREVARVLRPRTRFVLSWVAREWKGASGPPHRPSLAEATEAFEEEFLFLRSEYRRSATGRAGRGALPVYCAVLGRRSFRRPPMR